MIRPGLISLADAEDDGASRREELLDLLERSPRDGHAAVREARLPVGRHPTPVPGEDDGIDLDFFDRWKSAFVPGREWGEDAGQRLEALRDRGQ